MHRLRLVARVQAPAEPKTLVAFALLCVFELALSAALRAPVLGEWQPTEASADTVDAVATALWAASGGVLDALLWHSWRAALAPLRPLTLAGRFAGDLAWQLARYASALALIAATEGFVASVSVTVYTLEACTLPLTLCTTLLLDAAIAGRREHREAQLRESRALAERMRPLVARDFRNGELLQAREWALHEVGLDWFDEEELLDAWRRRHACDGSMRVWGYAAQ